MSLTEGQQIELTIDKPAAGGRMIARHHGQVVLVRGAIPGERVRALVEKAEKRLAYAVTKEVVEASPDRRPAGDDPLCGGALYSHIAYPRQLTIKSDVIRDAFARVGRHPIDGPIAVAASGEEGYRMRARFHVRGTRVGFYREGTHHLCDPASTRQLRPETVRAALAVAETLAPDLTIASIAITENIAGDQVAAHVELVSEGSDGGQTRVKPGSDQGQTRVKPGSDQGQTGVRPGSNQGQTRVRPGSDQGQTTFAAPSLRRGSAGSAPGTPPREN